MAAVELARSSKNVIHLDHVHLTKVLGILGLVRRPVELSVGGFYLAGNIELVSVFYAHREP